MWPVESQKPGAGSGAGAGRGKAETERTRETDIEWGEMGVIPSQVMLWKDVLGEPSSIGSAGATVTGQLKPSTDRIFKENLIR